MGSLCCYPNALNCSINSNGQLVAGACDSETILVEGICCPPETESCYINGNGQVIVKSCKDNYLNIEELCCPPMSNSCQVETNGTINSTSCQSGYQPVDNICCPPEVSSCQLSAEGQIVINTCNDNFKLVDNLCCPALSQSCNLTSNGTIFPSSCVDFYSIVNETCCPPETLECYLDTNGDIVVQSCNLTYQPQGQFCCPPGSNSCDLDSHGNIQPLNCTPGFNLINGTCCPPNVTSCVLLNNGTILNKTCSEAHYLSIHGTCLPCGENCIDCVLDPNSTNIKRSLCHQCNNSLLIWENKCVDQCPGDTHPSHRYCCPLHCNLCYDGSQSCSKCHLGYYEVNGVCSSTCPPHYLPNAQGECKSMQTLCSFVCDVNYLCEEGIFTDYCNITVPMIDVVAMISVIAAIGKLYVLLKIKEETTLMKLLRNHAYADILVSLIILTVFIPEAMASANPGSIIVFYGNILGCLFTIEIFLIGYLKMYGTTFFERNLSKIILGTYIITFLIAYGDFEITRTFRQSPYLFAALGGLIIIILDISMIIKIRKLDFKIDMRNLIIFPTILAVTWGISSIPLFGVSGSGTYFWLSFVASILNYSQPIFNTLLYYPVMLNGYRNIKRRLEANELSIQNFDGLSMQGDSLIEEPEFESSDD